MSKKNSEALAEAETPAADAPVTPPQEKKPEPVKNWQYWVSILRADSPLARGACASLKADWDAEITEAKFKDALEKFGGKKISWRKA